MPFPYLGPTDWPNYGLDGAYDIALAEDAANEVDAWITRPEGLTWIPDFMGNPCYMARKEPMETWTANAGFGPGTNVVVSIAGPQLVNSNIGEVVVLDRATTTVEAAVIVGIGTGTMTLGKVLGSHPSGATIEAGLTITEERQCPQERSITRASRFPLVRIVSGYGRYGYGRRDDQTAGMIQEFNLLAMVSHFGGPPEWIPIDVTQMDFRRNTGEIWVPAGALLAFYTDVRLGYVAGFQKSAIPQAVKRACANIIRSRQNGIDSAAIKTYQAGNQRYQMADATIIDKDTARLLQPYKLIGMF